MMNSDEGSMRLAKDDLDLLHLFRDDDGIALADFLLSELLVVKVAVVLITISVD